MSEGRDKEPFIPDTRPDPSYLHEFVLSALEILDGCEQAAVAVQGKPGNLETIMRGMHTLKGDSGYLGFSRLGAFCHDMETLLSGLIGRTIDLTADVTDGILKALDLLRETISRLETPGTAIPDPEPVWATIRSFSGEKSSPPDRPASTDSEAPRQAEIPEETRRVFGEQAASYRQTLRNLAAVGIPPDTRAAEGARRTLGAVSHAALRAAHPDISEAADATIDRMESGDERRYGDGLRELVSMLDTAAGPAEVRDRKETGDDERREARTAHRSLRVDERKIDGLFSLVNEFELALGRSDFILRGILDASRSSEGPVTELKDQLERFARLVAELRRNVETLRTIEAGTVLRKFERMVRDISLTQRKKIRLIISGASTEIDKTVADILTEPLTHAIRNACDHGIETAEERIGAGKNPEGTVSVELKQESRVLSVTIRDDGRGMDPERIRAKAEKLGIPTEDLHGRDLLELVFIPGFSTSENVSEISGRGIGMDIIRSSVRTIGGTVRLESAKGSGTALTLTVPVTIGVMNAVIAEVSGRPFAFPLDTIRTVTAAEDVVFHTVEGRKGILYEDAFVPSADAASIFHGHSDAGNGPEPGTAARILVFGTGENAFALTVPKIIGRAELPVRPAPDDLKNIPMITGVSVLGDGRIILVISPEELRNEADFLSETV